MCPQDDTLSVSTDIEGITQTTYGSVAGQVLKETFLDL